MLNICKGNDFALVIPIRRAEVTENVSELRPYDLTTAKSVEVNVVGTQGSRVGFRTVVEPDRVILYSEDAEVMMMGVYGIEVRVVTDEDVNLRFFDSTVFRVVNETAEADTPSDSYFGYDVFQLGVLGVSVGISDYETIPVEVYYDDGTVETLNLYAKRL